MWISADTHAKNKAMQHILKNLASNRLVRVPVDGERLAYQK